MTGLPVDEREELEGGLLGLVRTGGRLVRRLERLAQPLHGLCADIRPRPVVLDLVEGDGAEEVPVRRG
jgi:hypothetical protein